MNDEFKQKTLKLLADPIKLKDTNKPPIQSTQNLKISFKKLMDRIYMCKLTKIQYNHIDSIIQDELVIMNVMNGIINQVSQYQNP
jgi:hypothetical protein